MLTDVDMVVLATSLSIAGRAVLGALPFAIAAAYALSRPRLPGKSPARRPRPPASRPAARLGGFYAAAVIRTARAAWRMVGAKLRRASGVSSAGAALATAVMSFPLMVRAIRISFEALDPGLFEAAAMLRAGPWDRFWSLALPLAAPGVLAGAATAFAAGLGEFGAVITFASNIPGETQTLPLAIYAALQLPDGEALALRLASISFVLALGGLAIAEGLMAWSRRRMLG